MNTTSKNWSKWIWSNTRRNITSCGLLQLLTLAKIPQPFPLKSWMSFGWIVSSCTVTPNKLAWTPHCWNLHHKLTQRGDGVWDAAEGWSVADSNGGQSCSEGSELDSSGRSSLSTVGMSVSIPLSGEDPDLHIPWMWGAGWWSSDSLANSRGGEKSCSLGSGLEYMYASAPRGNSRHANSWTLQGGLASLQWGYLLPVPTQGKTQSPILLACRVVANGHQSQWPTLRGGESGNS